MKNQNKWLFILAYSWRYGIIKNVYSGGNLALMLLKLIDRKFHAPWHRAVIFEKAKTRLELHVFSSVEIVNSLRINEFTGGGVKRGLWAVCAGVWRLYESHLTPTPTNGAKQCKTDNGWSPTSLSSATCSLYNLFYLLIYLREPIEFS